VAVLEHHPGPFDLGLFDHPLGDGALSLSQRDVRNLEGEREGESGLYGYTCWAMLVMG